VQHADSGAAPFALVLGSGFSHGLVPTALELVTDSLPLWMASRKGNQPFESMSKIAPHERLGFAREFWQKFVEKNTTRGLTLPLNPNTGLPEINADAYKACFSPEYSGAVGDPGHARRFQREPMRLDRPRLNAAHFLLASLFGHQPGRSRENGALLRAQAAFCRLILTTNFYLFLQIAPQAVNRLYFMSDTP